MTKYAQDILDAQAAIKDAGVLLTWIKAADEEPDAVNPTPYFPAPSVGSQPIQFDVYCVFGVANRQLYFTILANAQTQDPRTNLIGYVAGGLPFTPAIGDYVVLPSGRAIIVTYMNITQPDAEPIIYELGFA